MRRIVDALLLAAIVAVAAALRFVRLGAPSLWLDEILDYDVASALTRQPLWRWLTGFASEHGPLFFATELAGRVAHAPEIAARIAPAIFGVAAVVAAWLAGRAVDRAAAAPFALLLAGSPLAIYYSREARPYALLVLLATAALALMLMECGGLPPLWVLRHETESGGKPPHSIAIALPLLMLLTTSGAAPLLIAIAITAALAWAIARNRTFAILALAAAASTALVPLVYRDMPRNPAAAAFNLPRDFAPRLMQSFSTAATDAAPVRRVAYVVAILAVAGAVALVRRDRLRGAIVIAMALLPAAIGLIALWRLQHWYAVRYVITALPAYLLLAAIGMTALVPRRAAEAVALLAAAFAVREGWSAATNESYRKLNWRAIAATIHEHAYDGDIVLATNEWSRVCLDFYLRRLPQRVRLVSAAESIAGAAAVAARAEPLWIVSAGFHRNDSIVDWSCRYPVVLASPLESFRLHYAPDLRHLYANRLTAADRRALAARYPSHVLQMDEREDAFLSGGWYGAERNGSGVSRWTGAAPAAALLFGGAGAHRITVRMLPHGRGQSVAVAVNGAVFARTQMSDGWRDYAFDVPAAQWRDGVNVLTLTFAHALAPHALDARSPDLRPLAAAVDEIAVTAPGAKPDPPLPELAATFRINESGEMLDASRGVARPAPPSLLGRVGIDPLRRIDIHDAAATVAYDSACMSDVDFLRTAYATILRRPLDAEAERYFVAALRRQPDRVAVTRALVDSAEFRRLQ